MTEKLITYKTALLSKELGFDWECKQRFEYFHKWNDDEKVVVNNDKEPIVNDNVFKYNWNDTQEWFLSAPTQSLLQKWIREKHGILVNPDYVDEDLKFPKNNGKYQYELWNINTKDWNHSSPYFNTYEDALEEGLYEALLLIQQNKNN